MTGETDVKVLYQELARMKQLSEDGTNFTYARLYHRIADLIRDVTGVDPRT